MLQLKNGRPHPSLQRGRFAITFGLLIGPLLMLTSTLRLLTGAPLDATLLTVLCSAVIATFLPIQFRWTGWMRLMIGYYIIASLVIFPVRVVAMGGLQSLVMVWAVAPALLGAQLGGMRLALLSTLVVIAEIVGIYALQTNGMVPVTDPNPLGEAATVVACIIFVTGMVMVSDKQHRLHAQHLEGALTRLEQTNSALATRTKEAQAANHAKGAFLANMSHEIRTPLNGVIGMADVLDQSKLDSSQRQMLSTLRQSAGLLMNVLNDILDLSRLDAGCAPIALAPFSIRQVVEQSVSLHSANADKKRLTLTAHIDSTLPKNQLGNAQRVQQVLNNLLSNALKFTAQGCIHVHVEPEEDDMVRFSVTDTGVGIPQDRLGAIFDRFTQAEVRVTREHGGTGLGLTISRSLLKTMGGDIGVRSSIGQGSTFWFRLPLPESAPQKEQRTAPQQQHFLRLRVLLAEDNLINQRVIRHALMRFGIHDIDIASDGHEALHMLERSPDYDILILDVEMPRMDGISATRQIRAMKSPASRLPIIGLSAHALPEIQQASLTAGMDAYLTKPLLAHELFATLSTFFPASTRAEA